MKYQPGNVLDRPRTDIVGNFAGSTPQDLFRQGLTHPVDILVGKDASYDELDVSTLKLPWIPGCCISRRNGKLCRKSFPLICAIPVVGGWSRPAAGDTPVERGDWFWTMRHWSDACYSSAMKSHVGQQKGLYTMIEPGSKDSIEAIFERAIENERKAADIYKQFSKLFSNNEEVSAFWRQLRKDEIHHANMLQDVRKSLTVEQSRSSCDKELLEKVKRIQYILRNVVIESIHSLNDAYELAHELESSEVNTIFKLLATEFGPSEEWEQIVVSEINTHLQRLMDFGGDFGDREWRKGVYAQTD